MALQSLEVFAPGVLTPPIDIVPNQPEALDLIQIINIDGLGPVKANVNSASYGSIDGEFLQGTNTPKRNIVLTLKMNPDWNNWSNEALRMVLYRYFMPETTVRLRFNTSHRPQVEISGVVESCEPNIFAKEQIYTVSVLCMQPYFVATNMSEIDGQTTNATDSTDFTINYEGDINTGFVVTLTPFSAVSLPGTFEFRFINDTPMTRVLIGSALVASSDLGPEISTVVRNKYWNTLPSSGAPVDNMKKIAPGSLWWDLRQGPNKVRITASAGVWNYALKYYARFGGL